MGIYDFFAANYTAAAEATSDSRITAGNGPQNFELSNESAPNGESTSDSSSDSDSTSDHNDGSHNFRRPFTDSENSNSSNSRSESESASEANISLSESEKQQSRSDSGSSSSGSGNSPKSKLMYDAWQNRGPSSSPDRSAIGAGSQASPTRSAGSSSTESALRGPLPTASYDNGENSTAAAEASLQTTDSYGWPVSASTNDDDDNNNNNNFGAEVLHPTARALTEKMLNEKSSSDSGGSRTPQRGNSERQTNDQSSSSEEKGEEESGGSTSRVQPKNTSKRRIGKEERSQGEESSASRSKSESSASDDSSVPAGPIPIETKFKTGVVTEESFSSVSSSSSDESGSQSEESSSNNSGQSKEESSQKSSSQSSSERSKESNAKSESSNPLKRMEERRQERISESEGSSASSRRNERENVDSQTSEGKGKIKNSSDASFGSSSSESRYERKSDASLLLDTKAKKEAARNDPNASKSPDSNSEESGFSPLPPLPPLPKPRIERLKGGSTSSSSGFSVSSSQTSKGSPSEKSRKRKSDRESSGSLASSSSRSKSSRSASPKPRVKKRDSKSSGTKSEVSMESFGSSSSSSSNSRTLMKSFGYVPPEAQVVSSDRDSSSSSKSASAKASRSKSRSDSPEPHIEKPEDKTTDSSKTSPASSKVSAFALGPPSSQSEKAKRKAGTDAEEEVNNFALDKKLELKSDSSSSSPDIPASDEKRRPYNDFLPSPSTDPEVRRTVDAVVRSEHDSDEFQWVPSDKNGWMPPFTHVPTTIQSIPARDAQHMERQPVLPHVRSQAKQFVVSEENYRPDPPFGYARSNENAFENMEMPPSYGNMLATGTYRPNLGHTVGNVPPVPRMDMKMRQKEYHGVPPVTEISLFPRYDDESTLGTEGFHYAPFMMGGPREFLSQQPQYAIPNTRQLNTPGPMVRMSEVLRSEGADPPEGKGPGRASSYLQFINKPTAPAPPAKFQEAKQEEKRHPSHAINADMSLRPEESENSWVPTQLKSELKSVVPFQLTPPKEDSKLEDPKALLYTQTTKPASMKSSSAASNWNPMETSQSSRNNAPSNAMATPSGSFRAEQLTNADDAMNEDEESEEEVIVEDGEDDDASSVYDEVTVASAATSDQNSRPASQMSEPESDSDSSSSSGLYHPTGILDSSSESSSESLQPPANHRPNMVPPNQRKPPIVTPYQRNQPNRTNDLENQKQPLNGRQKSKKPTACRNAIIALVCLLLIIAAFVVAYFLTREDESAPVVASVNPSTNRPTTFGPTQTPSLSPTVASLMPSLSPSRTPTTAPSRPPGDPEVEQDAYYKLIVSAYPQGGDAIQNRSSPQRSAFEWLRSVSNVQDLPDNRVLQRYALATIFYSTRGWEWSQASRWLSNEHECSWFSTSTAFDICDPNRQLTVLSLRENNLDGTVPAEVFALLPLIEEVQLHGNDLDGSIPSEVSNLSRLALFDLSSNQVFSDIPSELGGLSNLKRIALANNKIFSTIPTELGRLSLLETLDLGANQLTGTIPTALTRMTSLAGLSLYANYISGTVPRNFSSLSNLQLIYIDGNYLSGSVSNSLCQLQVREFWADCDRLTCSCCTTCCTAQGCGN
ncbi:unnamed protein product [Cylindrotheca closterium]|uniref:Uncharacterized protein n=1 Tax=Cylindrotheca closterium TaxID=2856 RepID=A0AAD2CLV0_9STRA|nr:unnamed protein product [Cylindrotheca closterium]